MKIAIFGDLHIDNSCSARRDDFISAVLMKLYQVRSNSDCGICLGDFFHHSRTITIPNLSRISEFLSCRDDYKWYTIMGNHDLDNDSEESLPQTALGVLCNSNLVETICPTIIRSFKVNREDGSSKTIKFYSSYVQLDKCKEHLKQLEIVDPSACNILLLHQLFEDAHDSKNGITYSDIEHLKFDYIFLGHEHSPFEGSLLKRLPNGSIICRPGSLLRTSAHTYNFSRTPSYLVLDTETLQLEAFTIDNLKPSSEIFEQDVYEQKKQIRDKFIETTAMVVDRYVDKMKSSKVKISKVSAIKKAFSYENALN